jgi:hypothetical protein
MDDVSGSVEDRFLALVRRELGAEDVRVIEAQDEAPVALNVLFARFADGRGVLATFGDAPADRDVRQRRLEMLAGTFAQTAHSTTREGSRPPRSLPDELHALVVRARGIDALVIDANSPIVWGTASSPNIDDREAAANDAVVLLDPSRQQLIADDNDTTTLESDTAIIDDEESRPRFIDERMPAPSATTPTHDSESAIASAVQTTSDPPPDGSASPMTLIRDSGQAAIEAVRALPVLDDLRKGRHLHHLVRDSRMAYLAHSFAGIYVLILVFDGPFDELRAERAVIDALPQIERLVLAIPPFDPEPAPMAKVISMRRRTRR